MFNFIQRSTVIVSSSIIGIIILWFFAAQGNAPFKDVARLSASLGEIAGLVGVSLLGLAMILATRLSIIERIFYGLNNVYVKHNHWGQIGFSLLLVHPLLLLTRYAMSVNDIWPLLFFSSNWPRNWGVAGLYLFAILIALTIYFRPKYHIWKWFHKLMGVAFLFSAIHIYMTPSVVMQFLPLKIVIFSVLGLGLVAYLYRTVFSIWKGSRHTFVVETIRNLPGSVLEVTMKSVGDAGVLRFSSGQFAFISFRQKGVSSEPHPFSITSSPHDERLTISIKQLGDFTKKLSTQLEEGTLSYVEGPFGNFSYKRGTQKNQIWIAGGIGITPFVSMARDFLMHTQPYTVTVFYSVKTHAEAVYLDMLNRIAAQSKGLFSVIPFYTDEVGGYLSASYITSHTQWHDDSDIYLCAPPRMIVSLRQQFRAHGVPRRFIHSEEFNL